MLGALGHPGAVGEQQHGGGREQQPAGGQVVRDHGRAGKRHAGVRQRHQQVGAEHPGQLARRDRALGEPDRAEHEHGGGGRGDEHGDERRAPHRRPDRRRRRRDRVQRDGGQRGGEAELGEVEEQPHRALAARADEHHRRAHHHRQHQVGGAASSRPSTSGSSDSDSECALPRTCAWITNSSVAAKPAASAHHGIRTSVPYGTRSRTTWCHNTNAATAVAAISAPSVTRVSRPSCRSTKLQTSDGRTSAGRTSGDRTSGDPTTEPLRSCTHGCRASRGPTCARRRRPGPSAGGPKRRPAPARRASARGPRGRRRRPRADRQVDRAGGQQRLDLVGRQLRPGREQARHEAGDDGGGLRGAAAAEVAAADAGAGELDVERRAGHAQGDHARPRGDHVGRAEAAAAREVGDTVVGGIDGVARVRGAGGDHERDRRPGCRASWASLAVVAGCGHDDDALAPQLLDRPGQHVVPVVAAVLDAEREVDDADIEPVGVPVVADPLERVEHLREARLAVGAGDLEADDTRARGHAGEAGERVAAGDQAGQVGAVAERVELGEPRVAPLGREVGSVHDPAGLRRGRRPGTTPESISATSTPVPSGAPAMSPRRRRSAASSLSSPMSAARAEAGSRSAIASEPEGCHPGRLRPASSVPADPVANGQALPFRGL